MSMQQPASEWHGFTPETGAPYARDMLDDGTVVRIETDGRGGTVEIVEQRGEPEAYGLGTTLPGRMRARLERLASQRPNAGTGGRALTQLVLGVLERHGPVTKADIARRVGIWTHEASGALNNLSRRGAVECYRHPSANGRKYLWKATD